MRPAGPTNDVHPSSTPYVQTPPCDLRSVRILSVFHSPVLIECVLEILSPPDCHVLVVFSIIIYTADTI